jgi:hypothetical protein
MELPMAKSDDGPSSWVLVIAPSLPPMPSCEFPPAPLTMETLDEENGTLKTRPVTEPPRPPWALVEVAPAFPAWTCAVPSEPMLLTSGSLDPAQIG